MRIGLYIEHGVGDGVGGAELQMAYLASVWSRQHDVDLIHHRPPFTRERVGRFSPDDLSRVTFRYVPREDEPPAHRNLLRRFRTAREWHRAVSDGYDVFVNCTHWVPCFCHAKVGLVLVLFPFYVRPERADGIAALPAWKRFRHRAYYGWEWRQRIATYRHCVAISAFSRDWTRRRWGIDCEIVYPPVMNPGTGEKQPLILSVGRFSTLAHTKKQLELMQAFGELQQTPLRDWTYASVGGLNNRAENRAYFDKVRAAGRGCSTVVEANVAPDILRTFFQSARVFWHATGFDDDTDDRPELSEHFGISTVEAMGAGCVPVVVNKGGQPEIVEHGVSGFVWNTIAELKRYTMLLAEDPQLWATMSAAAQRRAQAFSRERFLIGLSSRLGIELPQLVGTEPHPLRTCAFDSVA